MCNNASHRSGDDVAITLAIMASCPGRFEEQQFRPLAMVSGRNVRNALPMLQIRFGIQLFPSLVLEDYTLTNAWPNIEYPALTGRTEATEAEVLDPANLNRIRALTLNQGVTRFLALGKRAAAAVYAIGPVYHIRGPHPSNQCLNRKFVSNNALLDGRKSDRMQQWVNILVVTP